MGWHEGAVGTRGQVAVEVAVVAVHVAGHAVAANRRADIGGVADQFSSA